MMKKRRPLLTLIHRVCLGILFVMHEYRHSLKCLVGFKLANVSICPIYMVLLAGDKQQNPGPVKDPCLVCSRGCRKAQKAIQCDICDQWFHAKCIGMKASEYNQLCDLTKAWQCLKAYFLVLIHQFVALVKDLMRGTRGRITQYLREYSLKS